MSQHVFRANPHIEIILLVLQVVQVLFPWLLDWIPLGRRNEVRSQDALLHLGTVTLIHSVPFTFGRLFSLSHFG